jgi:hypothetical protein
MRINVSQTDQLFNPTLLLLPVGTFRANLQTVASRRLAVLAE